MTDAELIEIARAARRNAYAPYSDFAVGVALPAGDRESGHGRAAAVLEVDAVSGVRLEHGLAGAAADDHRHRQQVLRERPHIFSSLPSRHCCLTANY